jgi:hypothetical protein
MAFVLQMPKGVGKVSETQGGGALTITADALRSRFHDAVSSATISLAAVGSEAPHHTTMRPHNDP